MFKSKHIYNLTTHSINQRSKGQSLIQHFQLIDILTKRSSRRPRIESRFRQQQRKYIILVYMMPSLKDISTSFRLAVQAAANKLPGGVFNGPLTRIMDLEYCGTEFEVGNPPQKSFPRIDTDMCFIGPKCDVYPTLVQQLSDRGILKTGAFSIYFGPDEPDATGHPLLGGVGEAKRDGLVFTQKLESPWDVEYPFFTLDKDGKKTVWPIDPGNTVTWDTGAAYFGLPTAVFNVVADLQPSEVYRRIADCSHSRR